MPAKRTYAQHGDACATAHALELVGDRWNYPILRELMLAPKRFNELLSSVRGITPTALTTRIRFLEDAGLVQRVNLPAPARVSAYELSEWGTLLDPIMQELGRWAQASPTRTHEGGLTPDAAVQSMRTMVPTGLPHPQIDLELHLFDDRIADDPGYDYRITWGTAGFVAERGTNPQASARIDVDSSAWARILYDDLPLRSDGVHIEGQLHTVRRFVDSFASPSDKAIEEE